MINNRTNRVSEQLMSTKNKNIVSYCAVILRSWVNGSMAVTHDPLTHFHLWRVWELMPFLPPHDRDLLLRTCRQTEAKRYEYSGKLLCSRPIVSVLDYSNLIVALLFTTRSMEVIGLLCVFHGSLSHPHRNNMAVQLLPICRLICFRRRQNKTRL